MLVTKTYPWLPGSGWSVVRIADDCEVLSVYERHRELCDTMRREGKELFDLGAVPELAGTAAPPPFQNGTGGNMALCIPGTGKFIVTASAAHKGNLGENDFVKIESVSWRRKHIRFQCDEEGKVPSTDTLIVARIFEKYSRITAFVHFHCAVRTLYAIALPYPSYTAADLKKLSAIIDAHALTINMVDHNLFIKKVPDGKPDAAILIGGDIISTFARAKMLIKLAR